MVIPMFLNGVLSSRSLQSSKKTQVNSNNDILNPFLQQLLDRVTDFYAVSFNTFKGFPKDRWCLHFIDEKIKAWAH